MTDAPGKEQPFLDMAERIKRNLPNEFGGAILIVPPSGKIVSYAAFDPLPDNAAFWALAGSAVETAIKEWQLSVAGQNMLGGRR